MLQTANNRQGHDNQLKRVSTFQRAGGGGRRDELLPFRTGISAIREGGQHDLVAVRQSIRRPVSCLWQAEEQRASTAPARVSSWATADAETSNHNAVTLRTDSDRRGTRSHSQALRTTTEAFSEAAAGTSRGTISAPGKGGGGREGYGGGNGLSHRWVAGELKTYAGDRAEEALEYRPPSDVGMMGRTFVDPKATGPPLRSSHRVGPVGAMGEVVGLVDGCLV